MEHTHRQRKILEFIARFSAENGYAPTIREIRRALGISSNSVVMYHIVALQHAGALTRQAGYSRTIVLTPSSKKGLSVVACHAK